MSSQELTSAQLTEMAAGFQHWAGVATFLRCPLQPDMSNTDIGLIGFPYSGGNNVEVPITVGGDHSITTPILRAIGGGHSRHGPLGMIHFDSHADTYIVGADIACFRPPPDNPAQITALTASQIMLQFVAHIAEYRARSRAGGR